MAKFDSAMVDSASDDLHGSVNINSLNKEIVFSKDLQNAPLVNITINGHIVKVPLGITVIQACEIFNIEIPRFCYHDKLKIAGNCRMCLVEIQPGPPKPQASCAINVAEGMVINTESAMVKKAREGAMEFLLANHPLDCPICDQGGECDLQDQAFIYGSGKSRFDFEKRAVKDKNLGPLVKTQMTRCIHCTRCVRFMEDIAGTAEIGSFNRGNETEIATFLNESIKSELSGNIIDLCPVGALTSKPFAFKARKWELEHTYSIDIMDGVGSAIRIDHKADEVLRILPETNNEINECWISDKTRFAYDGLFVQRLANFYLKYNNILNKSTQEECFDAVCKHINLLSNQASEIAILLGDQVDVDTCNILGQIATKIGCKIACNQDGALINKSSRSNYIFNVKISEIEDCDVFVIVGSNPRLEAPVINLKIRKAFVEKKAKIFVLGQKVDLNYSYTHLGDQKSTLAKILDGTHEICATLSSAKKPLIILGQDAINDDDGYNVHSIVMSIAQKYCIRENNYIGFNMLHKVSSRVGALDFGCAKNTYKEVIESCINKDVKLLFAFGVDEFDLKDIKDTFIVYFGSHGDLGVKYASAIIPTAAYTEKSAYYINTEGRLQQTTKAVNLIGDALDDSLAIATIAKKCWSDISLEFDQALDLFNNLSTDVSGLSFDQNYSIPSGVFSIKMKSFFQTCPISRASKTMALCEQEIS
jgi:NADH-quinone oxidoreductase subunit G